ncbi:MAG: 7TM diverse intracellular signaling domain-containing protein [Steroidobacteraceae bacterium]
MTPAHEAAVSREATGTFRRMRLVFWACVGVLCSAVATAGPLVLEGEQGHGYSPAFLYLVDDAATMTPAEIRRLPASEFRQSRSNGIALGFIKGAVWLRFDVLNRSSAETPWLLEFADPLLDDIRVYQQSPNGEWRESRLGDKQDPSPDVVDALSPLMQISPPLDRTATIYVRVQSKSSMLVDLKVLTPRQFFQASMVSFLCYGAMFGIMVAMCLYNLGLYASLRDPNYVLYVLSISTSGLFLASLSGHAPRWMWPDYRQWSEEIYQAIVAVTVIAGLAFCTRFLEARRYAPALHRTMQVLMVLSALTVPLTAIAGFQQSIMLTGAVSASSGTVGLITATICLSRGQRSARYYLVAWALYCVGAVYAAARQHGLVANSFFSLHGMEIGTVLETVLMSLALSDRYNGLRLEKERAQHEAAESLRRMDRLKDEFLANTSHELRTPLQGIIGLAESMLDGATGRLSEAANRNLSMIVTSGQRLATLVNDILDFSKMKNHELSLRRRAVDLRVAVEVVTRLIMPLAESKTLALVNEVDPALPPVDADEDRLQQILHNLIGNAVKFTDSGSVRVRARVEDGRIRIEVVDTGPGIAPEYRERIFESFEQVEDSATRSHGGTGLGLAVSRRLVQLHGSDIDLDSTVGAGSTFSFALPVASEGAEQAPGAREATDRPIHALAAPVEAAVPVLVDVDADAGYDPRPVHAAGDGERIRILVVDDEPVNQLVMHNHLTLENFEVIRAESGVRALELLASGEKVDLILLDVMMPKLSGFEVCREIRKTHLPTQLPVVMVTARNQTQDLKEGLQVGANDYITKPVAKGELLARIRTHLNLLRINSAYSYYVPHEFLKFLDRESITDVQLGDNVEMEAAVLVSDIRGFTTMSEHMTPDENFRFVNDYLAVAGPPIRRNGGFVDRYSGDGVLAVFPGGADDALRAARETMQGLAGFNRERVSRGLEPVRIGIGLHSGRLRLGIVGELQRRQGDIFADAVNVASRVEGLTKTYGSSVIVSEALLQGLSDPDGMLPQRRALGRVLVKGRSGAVTLHEAYEFDAPDLAAHKHATREAFVRAGRHVDAGEHAEAVRILEVILAAHPGDAAARYLLDEAAARMRAA